MSRSTTRLHPAERPDRSVRVDLSCRRGCCAAARRRQGDAALTGVVSGGAASRPPRAFARDISATTVRHVAATMPMAGTTTNMPMGPAMADPAGMATSTMAGWMWTVRP